jgi:hypothetical protein
MDGVKLDSAVRRSLREQLREVLVELIFGLPLVVALAGIGG